MDPFSPVAPARIKVLVVPVGHISSERFSVCVERLNARAIVRIGDLETFDDIPFSPAESPNGSLLYDFTTSLPTPQQWALSPFELFREPMVVLGLLDSHTAKEKDLNEELEQAKRHLGEKYPYTKLKHAMVFSGVLGGVPPQHQTISLELRREPRPGAGDSLTKAMHDLSSKLLQELATFAKAIEVLPNVQLSTQAQDGTSSGMGGSQMQRSSSVRSAGSRTASPSPVGRPPTATGSDSAAGSTSLDGSRPTSPATRPGAPATTFDQMASANASGILSLSDSRTTQRSKALPFSAASEAKKVREMHPVRVRIVLASLYMMAGHWAQALEKLADHTSKARSLGDKLWYAKGLEHIVVCMVLMSWAGIGFHMPAVCTTSNERAPSLIVSRAPSPANFQASVRRLSSALPDLLTMVLNLYAHAGPPYDAMPLAAISEVTLRFSKLLAIVYRADGELDPKSLQKLVEAGSWTQNPDVEVESEETKTVAPSSRSDQTVAKPKARFGVGKSSRDHVVDMVAAALPDPPQRLAPSDHVMILAGMASVYSILDLKRKRSVTLKSLVEVLTAQLIQAQKLGAAEMGIHPAASLSSTDLGDGLYSSFENDGAGFRTMLLTLVRVFGVYTMDDEAPHTKRDVIGSAMAPFGDEGFHERVFVQAFGSMTLRFDVLRVCIELCEALPDPYGVLRLCGEMLRSAGPGEPVHIGDRKSLPVVQLAKEEQVRLASTISRTIAVAKHFGLENAVTQYWDDFIVRGVDVVEPDPPQALVRRSSNKASASNGPLLYNAHVKAPLGAAETKALAVGEEASFLVTLQNPYDFELVIESLQLVTEGVQLEASNVRVVLSAACLQQVQISVSPSTAGTLSVTGCKLKITGCKEQVFWIIERAPVPDAWEVDAASAKDPSGRPVTAVRSTVPLTITEPQPLLLIDSVSLPSQSLMMLEGEHRTFSVTLRNISPTPVNWMEVTIRTTVPDALVLSSDTSITIGSGETTSLAFDAFGKAGLEGAIVDFIYANAANQLNDNQFARVLPLQLDITVDEGIQLQHFDVHTLPNNDTSFLLTLTIQNMWPQQLSFRTSAGSGGSLFPRGREVLQLQLPKLPLIEPHNEHGEEQSDTVFYGNRLREAISIAWREDSIRSGVVTLDILRLSLAQLRVVRQDEVSLTVDVVEGDEPRLSTSKIAAVVEEQLVVQVRINNRGKNRHLVVRLVPSVVGADIALEKCIASTGALRRTLIAASGTSDMEFRLCPLLPMVASLVAVAEGIHGDGDQVWRSQQTLLHVQ